VTAVTTRAGDEHCGQRFRIVESSCVSLSRVGFDSSIYFVSCLTVRRKDRAERYCEQMVRNIKLILLPQQNIENSVGRKSSRVNV